MHRIVIVLVAALLLVAAAVANPIVPTLINEIQVAPDSLERIELNTRYWPGGYQDFSGWQIITNAGTATVNNGVVATGPDDYVVLDQSNVTGTFSLGDAGDMIILKCAPNESVVVSYPSPLCNLAQCWCPPAGMSVARLVYTVTWPMPDIIYNWYLTPRHRWAPRMTIRWAASSARCATRARNHSAARWFGLMGWAAGMRT